MDKTETGVVAHGNLWVLTRDGANVEVRSQLAAGHELGDRFWAQRNPRG